MKITSKETYTDYESTQPSQTQIQQLPVPFVKNTRALSPMEMPKKPKIKLQQSKSYNYEEEESFTEHNIWGDKEQELPFVISNSRYIPILELLKYRYETTTHQPISCHNIIVQAQRLILRHPQSRIKHIAIRKIQWIDFRDWSS